jgi:hypothetical protein
MRVTLSGAPPGEEPGTRAPAPAFAFEPPNPTSTPGSGHRRKDDVMKGLLLWALGIPLPIILVLYLFGALR